MANRKRLLNQVLFSAVLLAPTFASGVVSADEAPKSGLQDTPISRVDIATLSDEQKARVVNGQITDNQTSWVNAETGNVEWITDYVLVYQKSGKCDVVSTDKVTPATPTEDKKETKVSDVIAQATGVQASTIEKALPVTGEVSSKWFAVAGIGLATLGGYMVFRNRKTGKRVMLAVLVAGGLGVSGTALADSSDFLSVVETVKIELSSTFSYTAPESECWEYVGYIPEIASVPRESPVLENPEAKFETLDPTVETGNVTVNYVDEAGNTIADSKTIVDKGIVNTISRTKVTVGDSSEIIETPSASGLTYDSTTVKPQTIDFEGKTYELVQVKDGDVEQGVVPVGDTSVTYIYKHVPKVETSETTSETKGSVTIKYVDTEGNEIKNPYALVTDGVVSTTKTTTTLTDGKETDKQVVTTPTGLTYDTTTQKPETIDFKDNTYTFKEVKDDGVEQGNVVEGHTIITYIYEKAKNTVETTSEPVYGNVVTRYVNEVTGQEIVSGSHIVTQGIVANKVTTTTKDAKGNVVDTKTETVPTGLTYDTTMDKAKKDAEIAVLRTAPTEYVNSATGETVSAGTTTYVTQTANYALTIKGRMDHDDEYGLSAYSSATTIATKNGYDPSTIQLVNTDMSKADLGGEENYYNEERKYYFTFSKQVAQTVSSTDTVPYEFTRVDAQETGSVEEGTKVITYYYKPATASWTPKIEGENFVGGFSTVHTLARDL